MTILNFFANLWVTTLKTFFRKWRESIQNSLSHISLIASFLEYGFEATLRSQNVQNYLNQNLVIGSSLENGFEAILISKANVLASSKDQFSVFCKSLGDEMETIFYGSEAKVSKLFKVNFVDMALLRERFSSYINLKNECSELLKKVFFTFWKALSTQVLTIFCKS